MESGNQWADETGAVDGTFTDTW